MVSSDNYNDARTPTTMKLTIMKLGITMGCLLSCVGTGCVLDETNIGSDGEPAAGGTQTGAATTVADATDSQTSSAETETSVSLDTDSGEQTTGGWPGSGNACDGEEPDYIGQELPVILEELCGASPDRIEAWETEEEVKLCVRGQWLACSEPVGLNPVGPDEVGVEFNLDGTMTKLVVDAQGLVQRGIGIDSEGTWEYGTDGMQGSPPSILYSWTPQQGGLWVIRPVFTSEPEQMRTEAMGWLARP